MGIVKFKAGDVIHDVGDSISTMEIVTKGSIKVTDCNEGNFVIKAGSIIGIGEEIAKCYKFRYVAQTEGSYYSYNYSSLADVERVLDANEKILPILARTAIDAVLLSANVVTKQYERVNTEYTQLMDNLKEYPKICKQLGQEPRDFTDLGKIAALAKEVNANSWQYDFIYALARHKEELNDSFFSLDPKLAKGVILMADELLIKFSHEMEDLNLYNEALVRHALSFRQEFVLLRSRFEESKRNEAEDIENAPAIKNALDTILHYSGLDAEIAGRFKANVNNYKEIENKFESSDHIRKLRKDIGRDYLDLYKAVLLNSLITDMPVEARMFLYFGFVDEDLAGEDNTKTLYKFAKLWEADEKGKYLTAYDWLVKVYNGEVPPSRNDFDLDFEGDLKEKKRSGDIDEKEYNRLLTNNEAKLDFEIRNMFASGNRVTYGRVTTYIPIFDKANIIKPLDLAYVDVATITKAINKVRETDYSVFYRERVYANADLGITKFFVDQEIIPYVILMPNLGSRGFLWQDIEGRKRDTPGRMLISIFHMVDLEDTVLKLCGEFRWELCKTVQGVYWNNVQDPSLTSEYCDYLQFYKKNSSLSSDHKEKVRTALKKHNNNYREVFIADYLSYMKYERNGSLRLNKVARGIIANYCTFSKEIRTGLMSNPQYAESMKRFVIAHKDKVSQVDNLIRKLDSKGLEIPTEVYEQRDYLNF